MLSVAIRHSFGAFTLDASFNAPDGLTALFGRSGSGKTTIVNAVAGLLRPQWGRIILDQGVLSDSQSRIFLPPHRRGIGYVFQESRLFPHLTVRQNLLYGHWFTGRGRIADLDRVTDMLGIGPLLTRRPARLSGGERQRVALGRALLSHPRLLLMDEPLATLDQSRKEEILPYLERLRDQAGLPILYVSHSAAEIARLATTIVLVDHGRVTASGSAARILSDPQTAPLLGLVETGAILTARIDAQEPDGLTRLTTSAGQILMPAVPAPVGSTLRLRILAQDVMVATSLPRDISALNVIAAHIIDLTPVAGGMLIRMTAGTSGGPVILARVTARSAQTLGLSVGKPVYAVLKAVSVAPGTIGTHGS